MFRMCKMQVMHKILNPPLPSNDILLIKNLILYKWYLKIFLPHVEWYLTQQVFTYILAIVKIY